MENRAVSALRITCYTAYLTWCILSLFHFADTYKGQIVLLVLGLIGSAAFLAKEYITGGFTDNGE